MYAISHQIDHVSVCILLIQQHLHYFNVVPAGWSCRTIFYYVRLLPQKPTSVLCFRSEWQSKITAIQLYLSRTKEERKLFLTKFGEPKDSPTELDKILWTTWVSPFIAASRSWLYHEDCEQHVKIPNWTPMFNQKLFNSWPCLLCRKYS